ncbi:hypothetical protein MesoLjLc_22090 [Mesorhizobium sp. L-8-10]|nr:hypothetical protein MesoLjLc_22090 [Mesorhizobium sp. L-8-10]
MMAGILDLLSEPIDAPIDYSPPGRAPRNYVPGVLEALAASRGRNAVLKAYEPTKREWIGDRVFDAARAAGFSSSKAHEMRSNVGAVIDLVPGAGALLAGEDGGRAYNSGDYLGMATAAIGAIPGGKLVGKLAKKASPTVAAKVTNDVISELPMDEASRMARAKAMGYSDDVFWRGEANGKLPNEYPSGAHFSRDREYAAGFAQKGGQPDPREFRLDLSKAFTIGRPMTAGEYGRLVESAMAHDPQLAAQLATQFERSPEYMVGFGKARPDQMITDAPGATLTHELVSKSRALENVFRDAGFNAIDSGRDVRKLNGFGIRSAQAAFDPGKADKRGILLSLGALTPGLFGLASRPDPNQD